MNGVHRLTGLVNIEPGERRLVALLLLEYFCIGVTSVFTQSVAFALFLSAFGSQALPYSYLSVAVGASVVAFLYLKLTERYSLATSLIVNLGTLALVSILLWLGLRLPDHQWLVFALPIWFQIIANLTALALWTLAARLLDVRQGKRLFGLIGSGNWLAIAAGGFLVTPVVAWLGTPNLLLLAGLALVIALGFQIITLREYRAQLIVPTPTQSATKTASLAQGLLQNRYVLSILALVSLVWIGFFFIDNIFYDAAGSHITDVNQLASFIGTLIAAIGVIGLITTTFITGPVISRFGIGDSLLVLPGVLILVTGALALSGSLAGAGLIVFALASLDKSLDVSLTFTLDLSARAILYQPLPALQRARIQTIADGIVQPIAIGIAGLLLFVFNSLLAFHAVQLAYLFLVIGVAWILVALTLRRQYPQQLAQALANRHLGDHASLKIDRSALGVLQQTLQQPHAGAVLYAANVLAELEPSALAGALPSLLAHPSVDVRRDALERIERLRLTRALPALSPMLAGEPSPELRGLAVRTLAHVGGAAERRQAAQWLGDPSPRVRRGAIEGLLDGGESKEHAAAERALSDMACCSDAVERVLAAETLAEIPPNGNGPLLLGLLSDKNVQVQRAALRAIPAMPAPELWDIALADLSNPALCRAATSALVAGGENVLPLLANAAKQANPEILGGLAQVCGRIGGAQSVTLLNDWMGTPDPHARTEILAALVRLHFHAPDAGRIRTQIRNEVAYAAQLCATIVDLGQDPSLRLLIDALDAEIAQARDRVYYLLALLNDRAAVLNARENLNQAGSDKRAYALEVLDVTLPHDLKPVVFPLAEGLAPAQCLNKLAPIFPQPHWSRAERLREIISAANPAWSPWLVAAARYAAVHLGLSAPGSDAEGDQPMFSTIEKVLILKGVDIFAETPDEVLADVAEACEEMNVAAGETIFNKGDLGDTLYVVVSGRVRVHDDAVTFSELGDAEVFGEMALLDPEPRSASVTALQETRLLRLAEQPFQELLDERSEIARSIIKVLTRRLRARTSDLAHAMEHKKS